MPREDEEPVTKRYHPIIEELLTWAIGQRVEKGADGELRKVLPLEPSTVQNGIHEPTPEQRAQREKFLEGLKSIKSILDGLFDNSVKGFNQGAGYDNFVAGERAKTAENPYDNNLNAVADFSNGAQVSPLPVPNLNNAQRTKGV